jgi:hypothetical protein
MASADSPVDSNAAVSAAVSVTAVATADVKEQKWIGVKT